MLALAALAMSAPAVLAQGERHRLCVTCMGPDAVYQCEVAGEAGKTIAPQALQLYCIARLARDGQHQACAVRRQAQGACAGVERRLPYDAALLEIDAAPVPSAAQPPVAQEPEKRKDPQTVVEVGERAIDASKKSLKSIGATVKDGTDKTTNAAKSTWQCLASLFKDC